MSRLPWHKTLSFRFGVVLALALLAFALIREPLSELVLRLLGLDAINQTTHTVAAALLSAIIAIAVASALASALSRWLTGRLSRLSRAAVASADGEELPGPFDDSGNDEGIARKVARVIFPSIDKVDHFFCGDDARVSAPRWRSE